jgi:hypothetical protein
MNLILMNFVCAEHKHEFTAPHQSPYSYGEFLLRSRNNELRFLNAIDDKEFTEVEKMVELALSKTMREEKYLVIALHSIYGEVACDFDHDGNPFVMNSFPPCPICRTNKMASWDIAEPSTSIDQDILPVTHHIWKRMTTDEKYIAVCSALQKHS